jgi:hypothetical protein
LPKLRSALDEKDATVERHRRELDEVKEQAAQLPKLRSALDEKDATVEGHVRELREVREQAAQVPKLRAALVEKDATDGRHRSELSEAKEQAAAEAKEQAEQAAKLRAALAEKEVSEERHRSELSDAAEQAKSSSAQVAQLEAQLLELQAMAERSLARESELEEALALQKDLSKEESQQLRETDPSLGDDLRGVSVHHLVTALLEDVRALPGLGPRAALSDIEPVVLRGSGEALPCPRDGQPGAAYVDVLRGIDCAGPATHVLICARDCPLEDLARALEAHCGAAAMEPKRTYIWAAPFCKNLHRAGSQATEVELSQRCLRVGRALAVAGPWSGPGCLQLRSWSSSDLLVAFALSAEPSHTVEVISPPEEERRFRHALTGRTGTDIIDTAWRALQPPDGFAGSKEAEQLHSWFSRLLEQQIRLALYAGDLQGERGARMCDKAGWLLRELGLYEQAGQLLQDGLQLSLEAACPELSDSAQKASNDRLRQGLREGLRSSLEARWQCPGPHERAASKGTVPEGSGKAKFEIYEAMTTLEVYQLASWVFERFEDHDTPSVATLLTNMGVLKGKQDDHDGALAVFQHAVRIRESTGTLDSPAGAVLKQNLGYTLTILGDRVGAERAYEEAVRIRTLTFTLGTAVGHRLQKARQDLARSRSSPPRRPSLGREEQYWKEAQDDHVKPGRGRP